MFASSYVLSRMVTFMYGVTIYINVWHNPRCLRHTKVFKNKDSMFL